MLRVVISILALLLMTLQAPAPISEATPEEKPKPKPVPEKAAKKESAGGAVDKEEITAKLKDLENRWEAAVSRHDASVPRSLLADDFIGVSSKGKVENKSGLLAGFSQDTDTYQSAVNTTLDVHINSPTMAIVIASAREKGTSKDGKPFDRAVRFTDTWMERNGRWLCTASQVARIPLSE
jgi:ketosteroid isomerase-like protein